MSPRKFLQPALPALFVCAVLAAAPGLRRQQAERHRARAGPALTIGAPAPRAEYTHGTRIPLRAGARDREGTDLSAGIAWRSSLDGRLGQGAAVDVTLTPGAHTLTATVRDHDGRFAAASTVVLVSGVGTGVPGSLEADEQPVPAFELLAQNRFVAMFAPHGPGGSGSSGTVPIDGPLVRVSLRFTNGVGRTVRSLMLCYRTVGAPGLLRASLEDDDGSWRPAAGPVLHSIEFAPQPPSADARWHTLELPDDRVKALPPGRVYHLVIEPAEPAAFDASNRIELTAALARHPVPWRPYEPGAGGGLLSVEDPALAVLRTTGEAGQASWLVERGNFRASAPVFLLEDETGDWTGQPYDQHFEFRVAEDTLYGELIELQAPLDVDYVALYARAAGAAGDPLPSDHLYARFFEETPAGFLPTGPADVLVSNRGPLHRGRSHWFAALFPAPVHLSPGRWVLAVSSPDSSYAAGHDGYVFSAENSSAPLSPSRLPTYQRDRSVLVASTDGGAHFERVRDSADCAFVLGSFSDGPTDPLAVHDESDGLPEYPRQACAGELIELRVMNRNLGSRAAAGRLFARLVDPKTEEVLARTAYPALPKNHEETAVLTFAMPDHDLILRLEVGHVSAGRLSIDDRHTIEVRLAPE